MDMEFFVDLFKELWEINPVIAIILFAIPLYFIAKIIYYLFPRLFSSSDSSDFSSSYEPPTPEEIEDEERRQQDREETELALLLAHDVYERAKKRSHAVCSRCRNANWSSDDDGNEYCTYPHLGWGNS